MRDRHTCVHEHFRSNNRCACIRNSQLVHAGPDPETTAVVYHHQTQCLVNSTTVQLTRVSLACSTAIHLSYIAYKLLVRAERIELSTNAWQALILPLNYARALVRETGLEPVCLATADFKSAAYTIPPLSHCLVE